MPPRGSRVEVLRQAPEPTAVEVGVDEEEAGGSGGERGVRGPWRNMVSQVPGGWRWGDLLK